MNRQTNKNQEAISQQWARVIYRPSGQPLEQFNQEMAILVPMLAKPTSRVILAEDFNVDLLKLDANEQTHDFLNILYSS